MSRFNGARLKRREAHLCLDCPRPTELRPNGKRWFLRCAEHRSAQATRYRKTHGLEGETRIDPGTGEPEWWSPEELAAEHAPRCRCGLQLPCNDCLPKSATEFAQQRREVSEGVVRLTKR